MDTPAQGVIEMQDLQAAGFSGDDVDQWRANTTKELEDAGFSTTEVGEYFGDKNPDLAKFKAGFEANLQAKRDTGTQEGKTKSKETGPPEPPEMRQAEGFIDAFEAGFDMSVTGLTMDAPDMALAKNPGMFMRMASGIGQIAGDVPAMVGGALAGAAAGGALGTATVPGLGTVSGAVVGGFAGANAVPEGIRTALMEHYEKGDVKSFSDFWERAGAVAINSAKAGVIGAATGAVGGVVGKAVAGTALPVAVKTSTQLLSEVATMTTVGSALDGKMPEPEHFLDAALLVGALHGATTVAGKMYKTYAKTGMQPADMVTKAEQDPNFKQQLISDNVEVPVNAELVAPSSNSKPKPPEKFETTKPLKESNPDVSPEVNKILENVGEKSDAVKKKYTFDQLYTDVVDKLDPINKATEILNANKEELLADKNPYILSRMVNDAPAKAKHFFEKGTFDYETKKINGPGLSSIIKKADNVAELEAYMISKRVVEKSDQGLQTGFDVEAAHEVVNQHKAKYEAIAKEVTEFSNKSLDYVQKSGILSKEQVANMKEMNKDYVPFKRIFEPSDVIGAPKGGGKAGSLKAFKGSGREIQSPLTSITENTIELIKMAENNRPKAELIKLAEATKEQTLIKKVPESLKPVKIKAEEIVRALEDQGAITTLDSIKRNLKEQGLDVTDETIAQSFESENLFESNAIKDMLVFRKQSKDLTPTQFSVFRDGKRQVFETTPELAQALNTLGGDVTAQNVLFKLAHGITVVKKIGITFTPDFIVRNLIRDATTSSVFSKSKGLSPVEIYGAMGDIFKKSDVYYEWLKSGGANGAFLDMGERYITKDIKGLQSETNFLNSARNLIEKPVDFMRVAAELTEQSVRLSEFKKVRKTGGTLTEGGIASREITVDFQRVGAKVSALNSITAFMNVSIQGLDRTARAFKEDPKGIAIKGFTYITMPSILLWYANKDDERYKEIPRWEKDAFWIIPTDNWQEVKPEEADMLPDYMVRSNNGKIEVNKGSIYRIPKPQELGIVFGSLPERILEAFGTDNPAAMKDFGESLTNLVTPSFVPDAIAPVMEQYFNKSFFTGRDIVPNHLKGVLPEYQFVDYTSDTAKTLGKMIATVDKTNDFASPLVLDNYIQSWGGALGKYATQVMDKALVKAGVSPDKVKPTTTLSDIPFIKAFVVRFPQAGSNSIQDFYDNYEANSKVINTVKMLAKQGDFDNMQAEFDTGMNEGTIVRLDGIKEAISSQSGMIRSINKDPDMSPDEKRQLIDGLYMQMTEAAKQGNIFMQEIKKAKGK